MKRTPKRSTAVRGIRHPKPMRLGQEAKDKKRIDNLLELVIPIGVALLAERDFNRLLERILLGAMSICNADGRTLYLKTKDQQLKFVMVRNESMHIAMGGTTGVEIPYQPLRLYDDATGEPNFENVATSACLRAAAIAIADAYGEEGFDFSGAKAFDEQTGYRSISFLTIPLKDSASQVIGVLQLLNAQDETTRQVIPFDPTLQGIVESLALLAAAALETYSREQTLRERLDRLQIQIDDAGTTRQVSEITETDYFQSLKRKAEQLRK